MGFLFRCFGVFLRPTARYSVATLVGIGMVLGTAFIGAIGYGLSGTNTLEFCISCHEMRDTVYEEYRESKHYLSRSGVRAECPDCHVPKEFVPMLKAKILAAKDVWHTITGKIDTPEKFEAHRWEMASRVWAQMKASDSATCRSCHNLEAMDLENQDKTARKKHAAIKDEDADKTCIDCHKGVVHTEPDEPEDATEG